MQTFHIGLKPYLTIDYMKEDTMDPMHRAINLSRTGCRYGGPFGAVVTQDGEIIGEGFNVVPSQRDPTAHAAVMAIREAARFLKTSDLSDCELHVSCEPCPLCVAAAYYANIRKVYYAATHKDVANFGFGMEGWRMLPSDNMEFVQARELERIAARTVFDAWPAI